MTLLEAAKIIDPPAFEPGALITDFMRKFRQARAMGKARAILNPRADP